MSIASIRHESLKNMLRSPVGSYAAQARVPRQTGEVGLDSERAKMTVNGEPSPLPGMSVLNIGVLLGRFNLVLARVASSSVAADTVVLMPRSSGGACEYREKNSTSVEPTLYEIGSVTIAPSLSHQIMRAVLHSINREKQCVRNWDAN